MIFTIRTSNCRGTGALYLCADLKLWVSRWGVREMEWKGTGWWQLRENKNAVRSDEARGDGE